MDGCDVRLGVDFFDDRTSLASLANTIVYTGEIDRYYDYQLGKLEWRTVRFETEVMSTPNYQGNAVVNYTERDIPYTRIIEHKHFESFGADIDKNPMTVISREFSMEWHEGMEPYYPVNDNRNQKLAAEYLEMARKEKNVIFAGRLAEYKYYDMAPIIEQAFEIKL